MRKTSSRQRLSADSSFGLIFLAGIPVMHEYDTLTGRIEQQAGSKGYKSHMSDGYFMHGLMMVESRIHGYRGNDRKDA